MSHVVPIRPAALPSWRALHEALDAAGPVACRGVSSDLWTSERADDRQAAAYRCAGCPVIVPCAAYSAAAREKFGTWAGVDRTPGKATAIHRQKGEN